MSESAVQIPDLIQTAMGGKRMARRARRQSEEHIVCSCFVLSLFWVWGRGDVGDVGMKEVGRGNGVEAVAIGGEIPLMRD